MKARSGTVVSTIIVMGSTLASRLLGFVRIAAIGAVFGATGEADVLNLVFNIPNNLRKLLAEGALSSAFLPVLTRSHEEDPGGTASRELVRRLVGFQLLVLVPLILVSIFFSQQIVDVILDFPQAERQLLAGRLFRWIILYILFISIAAVFMGTLNSHSRFLVASLTPLLFSISVITSVLLLHQRLGIFAIVVGVIVGGVAQILVQIPAIRRLGYTALPRFDLASPRFRRVMRQWLPVVSTASVFTINQQIAFYFASGLADGSGSALSNALVFWQLPFGIFGAAITTVLFPAMSRQHAQNDLEGLRRSVQGGLRALLLLLVPAGAGLAILGEPIIAVALQRGAFTVADTLRAALVLRWYSVGLFSVAAYNFLQRYFYARGDYRTPLVVAIGTVVLDVVLSLYLKETNLGVGGLALANSIAFTAGFLVFLFYIRAQIAVPDRRLFVPLGESILASALAGVVAVILVRSTETHLWPDWWRRGSSVTGLAVLVVISFVSVAVIAGTYRLRGISLSAIIRRSPSTNGVETDTNGRYS